MTARQKEKKAAVIGHPVQHSLSPVIHNHWIKKYHLHAEYGAINIAPAALPHEWNALRTDPGYVGFNVTLPHKIAAMNLCDTLDDRARCIGAVNTVRIDADRRCHGSNTDAFGFLENLQEHCPQWREIPGPAVILGAGGAARAAVYALLRAGVRDIIIVNRDGVRAQKLAHDMMAALDRGDDPGMKTQKINIQTLDWHDRDAGAQMAGLLVNTTSLGMVGQPPLQINLGSASCVVYDIVYRPLMTPLLDEARERGLSVVTGMGMLIHQARPAFQGWFGVLPDIDPTLRAQIEGIAT